MLFNLRSAVYGDTLLVQIVFPAARTQLTLPTQDENRGSFIEKMPPEHQLPARPCNRPWDVRRLNCTGEQKQQQEGTQTRFQCKDQAAPIRVSGPAPRPGWCGLRTRLW